LDKVQKLSNPELFLIVGCIAFSFSSQKLVFAGESYMFVGMYEVLSESTQTVIFVTASVKEDERGGQDHTSASLLHQSATGHCAVNTHCFYMSAFLTSCFVLSAMDGKIEQHV
jgi:hypothetical protein